MFYVKSNDEWILNFQMQNFIIIFNIIFFKNRWNYTETFILEINYLNI